MVSNYVFQQLIFHQLVSSNPIRGMSLDFLKVEPGEGGKYYSSREEWRRFLGFVLKDDPDKPMPGKEAIPPTHKASA